MTGSAKWTLSKALANWLTPVTTEDRELDIELLRVVARSNRHGFIVQPIMAGFVAVAVLHWVSPIPVFIWFLAVNLTVALAYFPPARILHARPSTDDVGWWKSVCLLSALPGHIVWPTITIFLWQSPDLVAHAFAIVLLCACLAGAVAVYGPVVLLLVAAVVCYLPYLAILALSDQSPIIWLEPVLQVGFALMMLSIGLNVHRGASGSVRSRLANKKLVEELAEANARSEAARRAAEDANRAKSDFLASMSHDLRTPLNAIMGFSDLILQATYGPVAPARYTSYVRDIHESGVHLLSLINDILDLSKIEAGRRDLETRDVRLCEVAEEATHFIAPQALKAGVQIRTEVPLLAEMQGDERALIQIFANLVSNAVKFTPRGGTATIFARHLPDGGLALGVEDTGAGIDPRDMDRALQPFGQVGHYTSVEGQGTGLGLPIVKALMEAMGGTFHIESTVGVGTRVWGEFPASRIPRRRAIA